MKTDLNDRFINKYLRIDFPPENRTSIYDTKIPGFCLVVQPSGTMSFQLRYKNAAGASRRYTLGKYNPESFNAAKARKEARSRHAEVLTGRDIQETKRATKAKADRERRQTLKVFFEEKYKPYCLSHMKDGDHRVWLIDHYFVKAWPNRSLSAMNHWLLTNWRKRKLQEGFSAGGVNRPISALKALLNRAVDWGVIESNPLASLKPLKEDAGVIRYLTPDEDIALRAALDERQDGQREERDRYNEWLKERHREPFPCLTDEYTDYLKPMVLLAMNTGMRRGELFSLTVGDVKDDHVVVRGSGTKTGKSRIIPLTDEAKHVLTTWIDQIQPTDLIFPSPVTGTRFDNINTSWQALIRLSGIKNFRFHDLRHTFASNLAMRGVDLYVIKELLGHASIETTQRYAHLAPDYKTSAISKLNEPHSPTHKNYG